jgi:phospholipid/cholesterol/gamma-HCH transport system permease protein
MFVVDLVGGLGRRARNAGSVGLGAVRLSGALVRAGLTLPRAALGQWQGAFARQIQFTAWDALTLVAILALLCGAIIIGEANAQAVRFGLADTVGRIVVAAGVREIAPALTALIVAGRTGTAIAAELASARALGEADALDALGVDIMQYYVLPRVAGVAVATMSLTLLFDVFTLVGGLGAVLGLQQMPMDSYIESVRLALTVSDVYEAIGRGLLNGAGIAAASCVSGLIARRTATEVPRAVSRAMMWSSVVVIGVAALGIALRVLA